MQQKATAQLRETYFVFAALGWNLVCLYCSSPKGTDPIQNRAAERTRCWGRQQGGTSMQMSKMAGVERMEELHLHHFTPWELKIGTKNVLDRGKMENPSDKQLFRLVLENGSMLILNIRRGQCMGTADRWRLAGRWNFLTNVHFKFCNHYPLIGKFLSPLVVHFNTCIHLTILQGRCRKAIERIIESCLGGQTSKPA